MNETIAFMSDVRGWQHPERMPEGSRGLSESESDTPGWRPEDLQHPGGMRELLAEADVLPEPGHREHREHRESKFFLKTDVFPDHSWVVPFGGRLPGVPAESDSGLNPQLPSRIARPSCL
jgi:hypothetical protein